jgi:hypothetical protein
MRLLSGVFAAASLSFSLVAESLAEEAGMAASNQGSRQFCCKNQQY